MLAISLNMYVDSELEWETTLLIQVLGLKKRFIKDIRRWRILTEETVIALIILTSPGNVR